MPFKSGMFAMDTSFNSLIKSSIVEILQDSEIKEIIGELLTSNALKNHQIIVEKENSEKPLTVADTAKLFGVTKVTVHAWAKNGILIKYKVKGSNRTYFKYSEVQQAIVQMKQYKIR